MITRCPRPERLTALVDQAVTHAERDRLQSHLVHCRPCGALVDDLRQQRRMLREGAPQARPHTDLASRLVDIAGPGAAEPLWTRPFDPADRAVSLPSPTRRVRVAGASVAGILTLMVAVISAGWVAAPPVRMAGTEPAATGRAELASVMRVQPLAQDTMAGMLAANVELATDDEALVPSAARGGVLTDLQGLLERASDGTAPTFNGEQYGWMRSAAGAISARAQVRSLPDQRWLVTLRTDDGLEVATGHLPGNDDALPITLLTEHFDVTGYRAAHPVADRPTVVLEARRQGVLEARWWLDARSGLLLWRAGYDNAGQVVYSSGFTRLDVVGTAFVTKSPTALVSRPVSTELQLSQASVMAARGWSCADSLGDFALVQVAQDGPALHTAYSDGVNVVVVTQQPGALSGTPVGFFYDESVDAYRSSDSPNMLTWQSGRRVITVAGFGDVNEVDEAAARLPHDAPVLRTRPERVAAGWAALLGIAG